MGMSEKECISQVDSNIEDSLCGRKSQIQLLLSLLGTEGLPACPSLFIYGNASSGKTLVVKTLLTHLQVPCVFINCVELFNSRLIYDKILTTLCPAGIERPSKCDNMNDFVRSFKKLLNNKSLSEQTVYLVFDKAERLRDMDINILPALFRFQELTSEKVCTILITEIVWEKFQSGRGFWKPFIIHFPDYSKDDLTEILCMDCPAEYEVQFYFSYIQLVLSIFYQACRDLRELRHLAILNFSRYIEPIKNGEATCDDTIKLWKNIEPHLKKALQTVYLREVSSAQWEKLQQDESEAPIQSLSARTHIELPFFTKYLLIAAYLASYNPAKSDRRFFCNRTGKLTRREKLVKKHERTTNHLLGPKTFPLDRLLAIFYSVVEGKVAPSANIFMQISSLVSLHLLAQVGGDDQVDAPKYRCLVSLDFITSVCRTVGFDVKRYLYDFL
ncbi:origin recognition complex subunit 5-like [Liolophura sinensis]|uniref:origin recognition complex subunit 5-like n=1 Tax=Liolophura sinensis TaxID=3198878 RepID=UPI00315868EE